MSSTEKTEGRATNSSLHEEPDTNPLPDFVKRDIRYPDIHLVYADTRRHAEDWTHRFLTTALTDTTDPNPDTD